MLKAAKLEKKKKKNLVYWTKKIASFCFGLSGDQTPYLLIRSQRCNRLRHRFRKEKQEEHSTKGMQ
jgi:hypothetical protein